MKLRDITASDPTTALLVAKIEERSPLLRNYVEFYQSNGQAATERKVQGALEVASRNLGADYAEQKLSPDTFTVGRKIFGATASVDVAYERMHIGDVAGEMLSQVLRFGRGIAGKFHSLLINGDATKTAAEFNGLKALATGAQLVTAAANGLAVLPGSDNAARASQQVFLEKINETIVKAGGDNKVIVVNGKTLARLNTIAASAIQYTTDTFGKIIASYNGIPLVNVEDSGIPVIPFTETMGTAKDCASLYVACFSERDDLSFFTTNEGLKVYPMIQLGAAYKTTVDLILDSALFNTASVARLQGLKFADV